MSVSQCAGMWGQMQKWCFFRGSRPPHSCAGQQHRSDAQAHPVRRQAGGDNSDKSEGASRDGFSDAVTDLLQVGRTAATLKMTRCAGRWVRIGRRERRSSLPIRCPTF